MCPLGKSTEEELSRGFFILIFWVIGVFSFGNVTECKSLSKWLFPRETSSRQVFIFTLHFFDL